MGKGVVSVRLSCSLELVDQLYNAYMSSPNLGEYISLAVSSLSTGTSLTFAKMPVMMIYAFLCVTKLEVGDICMRLNTSILQSNLSIL